MITGAHVLLYTSEPAKVRAIFRDVFQWPHVDAGDGWLIFRLPPSEIGVHPSEDPDDDEGGQHQFTLMCDDIQRTVAELRAKGITVQGDPEDQGWGITVMVELPGHLHVMLYQPRHPVAATLP